MFKCEKCGAGSPEDCKCGKPERQPEVKFKEIKVNKQEYHIEENGTNHSRTAVIYFREGRFDYCKYELPKATSDQLLPECTTVYKDANAVIASGVVRVTTNAIEESEIEIPCETREFKKPAVVTSSTVLLVLK